jgi:NAD(P)-dependent dehydrogenase (short-subunit alcohol dehydrogenase family)
MSGFGSQSTAAEIVSGINLSGKTGIVTGGHAGIGLETTRALSQAGARVLVGARDPKKAQQTKKTYVKYHENKNSHDSFISPRPQDQ